MGGSNRVSRQVQLNREAICHEADVSGLAEAKYGLGYILEEQRQIARQSDARH
jgi:hypothetical protein